MNFRLGKYGRMPGNCGGMIPVEGAFRKVVLYKDYIQTYLDSGNINQIVWRLGSTLYYASFECS